MGVKEKYLAAKAKRTARISKGGMTKVDLQTQSRAADLKMARLQKQFEEVPGGAE